MIDLQACKFLKNRLQHRCFPVEFVKSGGCFRKHVTYDVIEMTRIIVHALLYSKELIPF